MHMMNQFNSQSRPSLDLCIQLELYWWPSRVQVQTHKQTLGIYIPLIKIQAF